MRNLAGEECYHLRERKLNPLRGCHKELSLWERRPELSTKPDAACCLPHSALLSLHSALILYSLTRILHKHWDVFMCLGEWGQLMGSGQWEEPPSQLTPLNLPYRLGRGIARPLGSYTVCLFTVFFGYKI